MTQEELMMLLSRMNPQDIEYLRSMLTGQESDPATGTGDIVDIGFDITRTSILNNEDEQFFENSRTEIIESGGRIGRIKEQRVWDCGHSNEYPFGGIDSFGHVVCKNCLRWCDRGNHPCCVLDSKLTRSGKRYCDYHRGLKRFFSPAFKREIKK